MADGITLDGTREWREAGRIARWRFSPWVDEARWSDVVWTFRALMEFYGSKWGLWTPLASLGERIEHSARMLVEARSLAVEEGALVRRPVRMVRRYAFDCWLPYLSHIAFGRRYHAWKYPEQYERLTLEAAAMVIDERKRLLETVREIIEAERKAHAQARVERGRILRAKGYTHGEVARALKISRRQAIRDAGVPPDPGTGLE